MSRTQPLTDPVTVEVVTLDDLNRALGSTMTLEQYRASKSLGRTTDDDVAELVVLLVAGQNDCGTA